MNILYMARNKPWQFMAFGFGSGLLPKAPGTWGSLAALLFMPLLSWFSLQSYILFLVITTLFGFWLCHKVANDLQVHDDGRIVWDEMVGIWITLLLAPSGIVWWMIGFLLFRFFDIRKPWLIGWADRTISGGFGIMLDDVLAGIFSWIVLQGIAWCYFAVLPLIHQS